jgi:hypothetical protein
LTSEGHGRFHGRDISSYLGYNGGQTDNDLLYDISAFEIGVVISKDLPGMGLDQ